MMMARLVAALVVAATPAMAAERHERCMALDAAKKAVAEDHGAWTVLTTDQLQFLRGVSATHPQTPAGIPFGDGAAMVRATGDKTSSLIFFIDGDRACDMLVIPDVMVKMVMDIGAGVVKHEGDGL